MIFFYFLIRNFDIVINWGFKSPTSFSQEQEEEIAFNLDNYMLSSLPFYRLCGGEDYLPQYGAGSGVWLSLTVSI